MARELQTERGRVVVRQAREDDLEGLRELRLEALQRHPEAFSMDYETDLNRPLAEWAERLKRNADPQGDVPLFLAERQPAAGQPAGLVGMTGVGRGGSTKTRHSGTIWGVYVRPEWRGQGVSRLLILTCLDWARAQGLRILTLGVTATNIPAIRLYLSCGFSVFGIEPLAMVTGGSEYDELWMSRRVDGPEAPAGDRSGIG